MSVPRLKDLSKIHDYPISIPFSDASFKLRDLEAFDGEIGWAKGRAE